MEIIAVIQAAALWCNNPTYPNGYGTTDEINKCRSELMACLDKSNGLEDNVKCFRKQKLK